jgi:beta-galactosidase
VVPGADDMLEVSVDGPARILAVGNGDPADHTRYGIPRRRAFHGLALALLQSTDDTGPVRVTVSAEGLGRASLELVVVRGDPRPRLP